METNKQVHTNILNNFISFYADMVENKLIKYDFLENKFVVLLKKIQII